MTSRHQHGGIVAVEIIRLSLDGFPSAVHSAKLHIIFEDGCTSTKEVSFHPDGIMFEVFKEQIRALIRPSEDGVG